MSNILILFAVLIAWVLLQRVILPRFGVST